MRKFGLLGVIVVTIILVIALMHHTQQSATTVQNPLRSQTPAKGNGSILIRASRVPFVGCKSDGQGGPVSAPRGESKVVNIDAKDAQGLAYYESENQFGVLAPRGWNCFGTYGSNGDSLFVSPEPISESTLFSTSSSGFSGPLIQLSRSSGDTSGRFSVAKTIARVFPAHRAFVKKVVEEGIEPASSFPFGAYPNDELTYKSDEMVEYQTPARTDGLGTDSLLLKDDNPISGVAILTGPDSDLLHLSVRLSPAQAGFTAPIIQQVERDVADQSQSTPSVASTNQAVASLPSSTQSKASKGFPVPEEMFVNAYVLANVGREDLGQDQLAQLAHDEYQMAKQMDTQTVLLGGEFFNGRSKRAMDYLYRLSRQRQQIPSNQP